VPSNSIRQLKSHNIVHSILVPDPLVLPPALVHHSLHSPLPRSRVQEPLDVLLLLRTHAVDGVQPWSCHFHLLRSVNDLFSQLHPGLLSALLSLQGLGQFVLTYLDVIFPFGS